MSAKVLSGREAAQVEPVRWPLAHEDHPARPEPTLAFTGSAPASLPPPEAGIAALHQQIEALKAETEKRVQAALTAGRREGETAAREAVGVEVNAEIEKMKQLGRELLATAPALRKQAETDLVRLAIAIARRILHREIQVDNEALLGLAKAALHKIDQREIHQIRTHPDSVLMLQRVLQTGKMQKQIEIIADARLAPGALVIETSRGQIDASVETQLDEIERGFTDLVDERGS